MTNFNRAKIICTSLLALAMLVFTSCSTQKITVAKEVSPSFKKNVSIFVELDENFDKIPELPDGFVNKVWTDNKKAKIVVIEEVERYKSLLKLSSINVADSKEKSSVTATIKMRSVRLDPIGGWITDGVKVTFVDSKTNESIGEVSSGRQLITPSVQSVFTSLVAATSDFWN